MKKIYSLEKCLTFRWPFKVLCFLKVPVIFRFSRTVGTLNRVLRFSDTAGNTTKKRINQMLNKCKKKHSLFIYSHWDNKVIMESKTKSIFLIRVPDPIVHQYTLFQRKMFVFIISNQNAKLALCLKWLCLPAHVTLLSYFLKSLSLSHQVFLTTHAHPVFQF